MDPADTYSIREFKEDLATCIEKVIAGHVIYIQNHKRRGNPRVAALVSVKDAQAIEQARAAQTP